MNGFIEIFNARLRDDLLNGEIPYTLRKARILIVGWRRRYNTVRPHVSSLQHAVPILCSLLTDPCALPMSRKTATRSPHLPSLSITDFRGIDDITIPRLAPVAWVGRTKRHRDLFLASRLWRIVSCRTTDTRTFLWIDETTTCCTRSQSDDHKNTGCYASTLDVGPSGCWAVRLSDGPGPSSLIKCRECF